MSSPTSDFQPLCAVSAIAIICMTWRPDAVTGCGIILIILSQYLLVKASFNLLHESLRYIVFLILRLSEVFVLMFGPTSTTTAEQEDASAKNEKQDTMTIAAAYDEKNMMKEEAAADSKVETTEAVAATGETEHMDDNDNNNNIQKKEDEQDETIPPPPPTTATAACSLWRAATGVAGVVVI